MEKSLEHCQFQFFGGVPVTTYRELRRFANQNKKAFMEYLFMQERSGLLALSGSAAAPWSSVNNFTHPPGEPVTSDNERPLDPIVEYEISKLITDHDFTENIRQRLIQGQWVRVTEEKSVKLHLGDGQRRPDQIVYRHNIKPDLSFLGEPEPEIELLTEDNYQQPNLSHFEYVDDWPLV